MLVLTVRIKSEPRPKLAFLKCCGHLYLSKVAALAYSLAGTRRRRCSWNCSSNSGHISSQAPEAAKSVRNFSWGMDLPRHQVWEAYSRSTGLRSRKCFFGGRGPEICRRNGEPFAVGGCRCISCSPGKMVNIALLPT